LAGTVGHSECVYAPAAECSERRRPALTHVKHGETDIDFGDSGLRLRRSSSVSAPPAVFNRLARGRGRPALRRQSAQFTARRWLAEPAVHLTRHAHSICPTAVAQRYAFKARKSDGFRSRPVKAVQRLLESSRVRRVQKCQPCLTRSSEWEVQPVPSFGR